MSAGRPTPKVTILLPVYNGERFITSAIRSVLDQTFADFELLIVDDCSTDATSTCLKRLSDPRIVVVANSENLGIQRSLNVGLRRARGRYIARIDDDDIWIDNDKLAKQIAFLEMNPQCGLIGAGAVVINESGKELFRFLNPCDDRAIRKMLLGRNCFVHSSVVFPKDEALKRGGYPESPARRHVEDYDLWLAIGCDRALANLPEHSVQYRLRASSISSTNRITQYKNNLRVVWRHASAYPNRTASLLRSFLRLILYGYLNLGVLRAITARTK
jgi:glycosyltransferase involved in cell wall biosynthesis